MGDWKPMSGNIRLECDDSSPDHKTFHTVKAFMNVRTGEVRLFSKQYVDLGGTLAFAKLLDEEVSSE